MHESRKISLRYMLIAATALLGAASFSPAGAQTSDAESDAAGGAPRWVTTWSAPPTAQDSVLFGQSRSFDNQTVRQIVHVSAGGTRVRLQLSNEYGVGALIVGSVHVATQATGASIVPGSDRTVTFRGQTTVVIPQGGVALSDALNMNVPSNANLAISIYVPQSTGLATYHQSGTQVAYISTPGDFSSAVDFPIEDPANQPLSRYWLTFVEVLPTRRIGALAIFADSISEGSTTTPNANRRVNDVVSSQLNLAGRAPRLAVFNQGTGCGRLLTDVCGPSGVSRFEREVLNAAGVTKVLLQLGTGDIIIPTVFDRPAELVSADQIIAGLRQLTLQARARGLEVYGATVLPFGSAPFGGIFTPENEAKRQAVNEWIRTTRLYDGVADYDAALRDPANPVALLPAYDVGDGLHPNDAGHNAMAQTILLSLH